MCKCSFIGIPKYLVMKKIENVKLRAARVCTGALIQTSYFFFLNELAWLTLESRRQAQP